VGEPPVLVDFVRVDGPDRVIADAAQLDLAAQLLDHDAVQVTARIMSPGRTVASLTQTPVRL